MASSFIAKLIIIDLFINLPLVFKPCPKNPLLQISFEEFFQGGDPWNFSLFKRDLKPPSLWLTRAQHSGPPPP
jgi:hypothetical protein